MKRRMFNSFHTAGTRDGEATVWALRSVTMRGKPNENDVACQSESEKCCMGDVHALC